jgi:hypothetical protein
MSQPKLRDTPLTLSPEDSCAGSSWIYTLTISDYIILRFRHTENIGRLATIGIFVAEALEYTTAYKYSRAVPFLLDRPSMISPGGIKVNSEAGQLS